MSKTDKKQSTYISFPTQILDITANVFDSVLWGYVEGWERSLRKTKVSMHAGVAKMAEDLKVSDDTVSRSLRRLVDLGLIAYKRYPRGIWITTNKDVIKAWNKAKVIPKNTGSPDEAIPQKRVSKRYRKLTDLSDTAKYGVYDLTNPSSLHRSSRSPNEANPTQEKEGTYDSVTDSQSETTRTKLPSAPSLSISDRVIGMVNMAFPSNPNAVMTKIRMAGWDERRVEAALMKTDASKGVNYFASICRGMSDDDIEKVLKKPEVRDQTSQQPERIMSKDGNSVKINGEWLKAATPYENMPAPPQHDERFYSAGAVFENRLYRAYKILKIISKEDYLKLAFPPSFISRTSDRYTAGEIDLAEYIRINVEEQKKYGITKENTE
jgi:hypothetical protein